MKNLFAAIAVLLTTSSGVSAIEPEYVRNIKHIEVVLSNLIDNGCWTKLAETKQYAEEKLRGLGATIYDGGDKYYGEYYMLVVRLQAYQENGVCSGIILIDLETAVEIDNQQHDAVYKSGAYLFLNMKDIDNYVNEQIKEFLTPYEQ